MRLYFQKKQICRRGCVSPNWYFYYIWSFQCTLKWQRREFGNRIIEEACAIWPYLKIAHGKSGNSHTQGSVEHPHQDTENIFQARIAWKAITSVNDPKDYILCNLWRTEYLMKPSSGLPAKYGLKMSSFQNDYRTI